MRLRALAGALVSALLLAAEAPVAPFEVRVIPPDDVFHFAPRVELPGRPSLALVPVTLSRGSPTSSMRWITPMWATPRAPPPLKARATFGRPKSSTRGAKVKTMSGAMTRTSKAAAWARTGPGARMAANTTDVTPTGGLIPGRPPRAGPP